MAWDDLPTDCQLWLAEGAIERASTMLATKAESLAEDIERGEIEDRGGADALRLLARLVRLANLQNQVAEGHA